LWQFVVSVPFGVFVCVTNARLHSKRFNPKATRMSTSTFLSPLSKLLRFFHKSRDQWKSKCKAAKKEVNSLKIRLAKMKASRERWKQQALGPVVIGGSASAQTIEPTSKKNAAARPTGLSPRRRSLSTAGASSGR
jgi:hypothetical protein